MIKMISQSALTLTWVIAILPSSLNAAMYKCTGEKGAVSYSDRPCPLGNETLPTPTLPRSIQQHTSPAAPLYPVPASPQIQPSSVESRPNADLERVQSGLRSSDTATRARAVLDLGTSPQAVPQLIQMLGDEGMVQITATGALGFFVGTIGEMAAARLGGVGDAAVNPLLEALADAKPHARLNAVSALGQLKAATATDAVVRALSDSNPGVRDAAAKALLTLEFREPGLAPILIRNVRNHPTDKNPAVAFSALDYLGFLNDPAAIAFLRTATQDPDDRLSHNALQAFLKGTDATAVPVLLEFLKDGDVRKRQVAVSAISKLAETKALGVHAPEVETALLAATHDSNLDIRESAQLALHHLNPSLHPSSRRD